MLFKKMRKGILIGLSVVLIGLTLFLIASIPVTRVDEVINTSFSVAPGTKYGPYDAGTVYHTRVLIFKSILKGDMTVEGQGLYLNVNGCNAQHLQGVYVKEGMSFVIEPANDQYTFTFDNTEGSAPSLVKFTIREVWIWSFSLLVWILGLIGLFILIPSGFSIFAITYIRNRKRKYQPGLSQNPNFMLEVSAMAKVRWFGILQLIELAIGWVSSTWFYAGFLSRLLATVTSQGNPQGSFPAVFGVFLQYLIIILPIMAAILLV